MLNSLDSLLKGYEDIIKKSRESCNAELERIRQLIFDINTSFFKSFTIIHSQEAGHSLISVCLFELARVSAQILFFSSSGLYRNAFYNIRHMLESSVQASYIDARHPDLDVETKIEILKEVEDRVEYRAIRLVGELEIDFKDKLKSEYKRLSRIVHPSHEQIITTIRDVAKLEAIPGPVECGKISEIYDSMKAMYDIFFSLYIKPFPGLRESLKKNPDFVSNIKKYRLTLVSKVLNVSI